MRILIRVAAIVIVFSGCGGEAPLAQQPSLPKSKKKVARAEAPPPKPKPAVSVAPDAYPDTQQAITALTAALKSQGRDEADKVVGWLGLKKEASVPALGQMLKAPDGPLETQITACWALRQLGPAATPVLMENLDHPTQQVQVKVLESLSMIKPLDAKAVAKFVELIKSQDQRLRQAALQGLARIGPPGKEAVPGLLDILNSTTETEALRNDAKAALKKVDPRRGLMGVAEKANKQEK